MDEVRLAEEWRRMVNVVARAGLYWEAEDIVQEAVACCLRSGSAVRRPEQYFRQAVRNRAARLRRRWAVQGRARPLRLPEERDDDDDEWREEPVFLRHEDDVEEVVAARDEAERLVAALGRLRRWDRLLVWLYWVVGAPAAVVGSATGTSDSYVRVRTHRLRHRVLSLMMSEGGKGQC